MNELVYYAEQLVTPLYAENAIFRRIAGVEF